MCRFRRYVSLADDCAKANPFLSAELKWHKEIALSIVMCDDRKQHHLLLNFFNKSQPVGSMGRNVFLRHFSVISQGAFQLNA